jgi:hypothetical protein
VAEAPVAAAPAEVEAPAPAPVAAPVAPPAAVADTRTLSDKAQNKLAALRRLLDLAAHHAELAHEGGSWKKTVAAIGAANAALVTATAALDRSGWKALKDEVSDLSHLLSAFVQGAPTKRRLKVLRKALERFGAALGA